MRKSILSVILIIAIPLWVFSQQQLQNPGFEEWEDAGTVRDEPVNWSSIKTSDNDTLNTPAPVVWDISDDAHSGNYSIKLFNVRIWGIMATGILTNGIVHPSFIPDSGYVYTVPEDVMVILEKSCFDCHTTESKKDKAKNKLNFSTWNELSKAKKVGKLNAICEEVENGDMPTEKYISYYPDSQLNDEQVSALCNWVDSEIENLMDSK